MCYYIIIIPTNQSYNWFEKLIAKINYNIPQEGENKKIQTSQLDCIFPCNFRIFFFRVPQKHGICNQI